jgi:hypothetical protein
MPILNLNLFRFRFICLRINYPLDLVLDQDLVKVIMEFITRGVT